MSRRFLLLCILVSAGSAYCGGNTTGDDPGQSGPQSVAVDQVRAVDGEWIAGLVVPGDVVFLHTVPTDAGPSAAKVSAVAPTGGSERVLAESGELAPGEFNPLAIRNGNVFWRTLDGIYRAPITSGASAQVLADQSLRTAFALDGASGMYVGSPADKSLLAFQSTEGAPLKSLVADPGFVVTGIARTPAAIWIGYVEDRWTGGVFGDTPLSGGLRRFDTETQAATVQSFGARLAVSAIAALGSTVVYSQGKSLFFITDQAATPTRLDGVPASVLALDTDFAYWATPAGALGRTDIHTGASTTLLVRASTVTGIALSADHVYWAEQGSLFRIAK